jgi:peptidoglycan/LPS O-acetylase OafA/YrhL
MGDDSPGALHLLDFHYFKLGYSFVANVALALLTSIFTLWTVRVRSSRIDRALGSLSYALYLVHFPIMLLIGKSPLIAWSLSAAGAVAVWIASMPFEWARAKFVVAWPKPAQTAQVIT